MSVNDVLASQPLAMGRTAEMYPWEDGWLLKLYHEWFNPEYVLLEQRATQAVQEVGLPVPAAGEIIEVAGRIGLLIEQVEGVCMVDVISQQPVRGLGFAPLLAKLHADLHAQPLNADLSSLRRRLEYKILHAKPLPENLRRKALARLEGMPDGDRVCHGDFHPGNIVVTSDGPVVIDWIDATIGDPLADVARTTIVALGSAATADSITFRLLIRLMHHIYVWRYFQLRPGGREIYRQWLPIIAAGRLSEGIEELDGWLLTQARRRLGKDD